MTMFNPRFNNLISALPYLCFGALLISLFSCGGGGYVAEKEEELIEEFIDDDELVEVTPKSIRLRKKLLSEIERKRKTR